MKVLIVAPFYGENVQVGGAEAVVHMLASGLVANGVSVVVLCTHGDSSSKVTFIDGVKIINVAPHNLFWYLHKNSHTAVAKVFWHCIDIWNPMMFFVARNIIEKEQPDVVHFHKLTGFSLSVWFSARKLGIHRLVQTCHDFEVLCPETSMQGKIGRFIEDKKWFVRPYLMWRAKLSTGIGVVTAPSRYTLDYISTYGFFKHARRVTIPNTHGYTRTQCQQLQSKLMVSKVVNKPGPLRVLFIGRLTEMKGVEILCRAVDQRLAEGDEITLDVAGSGRQERPLRERYGGKYIKFHGQVAGAYKDTLLRRADLMVVPSICPEVFGIVIVEAFAYGLPVLATEVGGIPELIEPGKTGFLVPPGDVQALAEVLGELVRQRRILEDMTTNCFAAALKYCSEDITQSYLSLYASVTGDIGNRA